MIQLLNSNGVASCIFCVVLDWLYILLCLFSLTNRVLLYVNFRYKSKSLDISSFRDDFSFL